MNSPCSVYVEGRIYETRRRKRARETEREKEREKKREKEREKEREREREKERETEREYLVLSIKLRAYHSVKDTPPTKL